MNKKISLLAVILMLLAMTARAEPVVGFSDNKIKVNLGDRFFMALYISDAPRTEGGGLSLYYDATVVQVIAVSVNETVWDFVNRKGEVNNIDGRVNDILFSSFNGVSGSAEIATVEFEAVGHGNSEIILAESEMNPFASEGKRLSVSFGKAKVKVRGKNQ